MNDLIRCENMKTSGIQWVGEIPSDWRIYTLYQIVSQVKNKNTDLREKNLLSLSYGRIIRKNIDSTDGLLPASFDGYNIIEAGDIVLRLTDLQNDHTSLRVGLSNERGIITSAYITLRPSNKDYSNYLYYLLHAFDLKKGFYGMGSGVRQGLNYDAVKEMRVILPTSSKELKAITDYLDKLVSSIDTIIKETRNTIESYARLKTSIIEEATISGICEHSRLKESGLEWITKIPSDWSICRIKELFTYGKGLPITKANLILKGIPVISYGQIHAKDNNGTELKEKYYRYVSESFLKDNPESLVHKGDILMADTSEDIDGCGNCIYVDKELTLFAGYHTIILKTKEQSDNKYLAYLFQTNAWRSQIRTRISGVKVFSVSRRILNTLTVLQPPKKEREEIVAYLDNKVGQIDSIISCKNKLIQDLELYKRSMIYEVVTGKRKVV